MTCIENSSSSFDGSIDGAIKYSQTARGRFDRWAHENPTATKVAFVGLAILFSPIIVPVLSIAAIAGIIKGASDGHSTGSTIKKMVRLLSSVFDFVIPEKFDMETHVFQEGVHGESKLKYEGDIPVLTLGKVSSEDIESFKTVGIDEGYLLAESIQKILKKWDSFLWLVFPSPEKVPNLCEKLKKQIPPQYLKEMEGIVEGFNKKMEGKDQLTLEKILLLHLLPDVLHSRSTDLEKELQTSQSLPAPQPSGVPSLPLPSFGCTVVLDQDEDKHVIFGRNMDWPSFGVAGRYSFVVRRQIDDMTTMEIGTPGLVGTATGMSSKGLALAMNVCQGKTQNSQKGLPACILNRMCLEGCETLEEVDAFFCEHAPLGPYHLSVAQESQARSYHFYQGDDNQHYTRTLESGKGPIVTTNCCYRAEGSYSPYFNSEERERNIQILYQQQREHTSKRDRVRQALTLPLVNNCETLHHVLMHPHNQSMELVFGNSFAGDGDLHTIKM